MIGAVLIVGACVWFLAERARQQALTEQLQGELEAMGSSLKILPQPLEKVMAPRIPSRSEVPLILTRLERASAAAGLGWPRADYDVKSASMEGLASLEVRCSLKGTYPQLRSLLTTLLQETPTLTFRELTLTRSSADKAELEARFTVAVYLSDPVLGGRVARP